MKTLYLLTLIFGISQSYAQTIQFEQNSRVKKENQNIFQDVKAGDKIVLKPSESLFVITEKNLPLVVLNPSSKASTLTVTESNLSSMLQEQLQPALNAATNEIVNELRKAENLIQQKNYSQALTGVNQLKTKYQGVSAIYFISGTIYYLLNNRNAAIEDLEKGLKIEPNQDAATKLLAKLKAGG